MHNAIIITGTDTGIGKTVFASALTQALGAIYWKPVQAGLIEETDTEIAARLSKRPTLPEAYRLSLPASPHLASQAEGTRIDPDQLKLPEVPGVLVVEGAGGVMVPLNNDTLFLDVFARWGAPVVLCAGTAIGTINHSLLSLAALRHAGCSVIGVAFIGAANSKVEKSICDFGKCSHLGRLPPLPRLTSETLKKAFSENFDRAIFLRKQGPT